MNRILNFLDYPIPQNMAECLEKYSQGRFKSEERPKHELEAIYKTISKDKIGYNLPLVYEKFLRKLKNKLHF